MERGTPKTVFETRVRYAETDQMGVVYYANYLVWAEAARAEYMRKRGYTYDRLEKEEGILLPVKEAFVNYVSSARYDETIAVTVWLDSITRVRLKAVYAMHEKESGRLVATGHTVHPFVGKDLKIVRVPQTLIDRFLSEETDA